MTGDREERSVFGTKSLCLGDMCYVQTLSVAKDSIQKEGEEGETGHVAKTAWT